jgi:hypothetical protein
MSAMLDRLRQLHSLRPQHARDEAVAEPVRRDRAFDSGSLSAGRALEDLVPGGVVETDVGVCYMGTQTYSSEMVYGVRPLSDLLLHRPDQLAQHLPHFNLDAVTDFTSAVFLDTETTGLGAGASTYCFMVGVGSFERREGQRAHSRDDANHFIVRQFFMRHPGEEPALLTSLADFLADRTLIITFNGRGFDAPLLRARYLQNRRLLAANAAPTLLLDPGAPHLDLLTPARRLWKRRLQSCRLINLEEQILLRQRTEDDVPGSLIPQMYVDYLNSNDAGEMRRVFYHNGQDIVSMAALAERICGLLRADDTERGIHGLDWLSLGRSHERAGERQAAENAYRRAIDALTDRKAQAEAFYALGQLQKQQQRWTEAAATWEQWLTTVPSADATPYIELAKVCEWQLRDLEQAEMWTGWGLHMVNSLQPWQRFPGQLADLEHRLKRLERKRVDAAQ